MLIHKRPIGTVAYMGGLPAILERFMYSYIQMMQYNTEYLCTSKTYIHYDRSRVSYHAKARNELVQSMRGDWILMLDSDHEPDPDLTARMLNIFKKYKLDVLVGIYQVKTFPYPPLLYQWRDEEKQSEFDLMASFTNPEGAEIFKVAAAGAGCLMINRMTIYRILNELEELPFNPRQQDEGKLMLSEDLSFFKRCSLLDISVYAAANIECPHLDLAQITLEANVKANKVGMESIERSVEARKFSG